MKPIKALILDDEQLAIDTLKWQIEHYCPSIQVIHTSTNPITAKAFIDEQQIDICFLDIDMPEMNGFEFIHLWNKAPFDIIFTTAYSEHAIKAFKVSATDYLLKPIDEEELVLTIEKYIANKSNQIEHSTNDQLQLLFAQLNSSKKYVDKIALPTSEGVHLVEVDKIVRLEADKNYTTVFLLDAAKIMVSKTLKEVESSLDPERFFRIHQSHTIDLQKISMYQRGTGGSVTLQNGDVLPVSKYRKNELLKLLNI